MIKNTRIQVYPAATTNRGSRPVSRVPFDIVEHCPPMVAVVLGEAPFIEECWVRYRCGRLFVRRTVDKNGAWTKWTAFRFEPKIGNAWSLV